MASSALDVQLTMVKVMQALRISDELIIQPIGLESDNYINAYEFKQKKSVSFKETPSDNKWNISTSEPTTSTFTPPIEIGQHSLTHSIQDTPYAQNQLVGTAPEVVRLKSKKDLNKLLAAQKTSTPQAAPACSLEFRKVSLKSNCAETGGQHVVQSANDSKVEIKRSVGF